jgi:DNA-binding SARP family transcriptional activator
MRERLGIGLARACECLAEACAWNGEPQLGVDLASQAVAAQPLGESGQRALMRAHLAAGNRAAALLADQRCRERVSDALGVAPSTETEALHLQVLRAR